MKYVITKLLQSRCAASLSRDFRFEPILTSLRFGSTSATDTKKKENKVVVLQENILKKTSPYKVDWLGLHRSWLFIEKYLKVIKNAFNWKDSGHDAFAQQFFKKNHVVYYFRTAKDLAYWYVFTDEDGGGHSWAELKQGSNEMTLLFRGYLNQKPPAAYIHQIKDPNEQVTYTGTVFLETKPFYTILDRKENMTFENFNCIKIRLRGDGRKYWLEMSVSVIDDIRHVYRYPIHTRGGPLWEEFEVPFSKFSARLEGDGSFLTTQEPFPTKTVNNIRFLLNDGIDGPFQLEIDYIALTNNSKFTSVKDDPDFDVPDIHNPWQPINELSG